MKVWILEVVLPFCSSIFFQAACWRSCSKLLQEKQIKFYTLQFFHFHLVFHNILHFIMHNHDNPLNLLSLVRLFVNLQRKLDESHVQLLNQPRFPLIEWVSDENELSVFNNNISHVSKLNKLTSLFSLY